MVLSSEGLILIIKAPSQRHVEDVILKFQSESRSNKAQRLHRLEYVNQIFVVLYRYQYMVRVALASKAS
jgi:hypothetical protein